MILRADKLVFVGLTPNYLSLRDQCAHWSRNDRKLEGKSTNTNLSFCRYRIQKYRAALTARYLLFYFASLAAFRSSLVFANRSREGTRITQISAAVKPPLYRQ